VLFELPLRSVRNRPDAEAERQAAELDDCTLDSAQAQGRTG
jgi:hypothetical protein